ncbi:MAG: hypothetical protein ACJAVI_001462 [Candidatus Azotimanducaceae bacterium]|jgi:uncharacterized protein (DUF934 family)
MGKTIIKDGVLVEDDWLIDRSERVSSPDAGKLTESNRVISLTEWRQNKDRYITDAGAKGLALCNVDDVLELVDDLQYFDLICLDFPEAGDGRAYSQAKMLRDRLGYQKEIRATGEVLTDQLFLMRRSGINAFELREGQDPEASLQRLAPFSVSYQ